MARFRDDSYDEEYDDAPSRRRALLNEMGPEPATPATAAPAPTEAPAPPSGGPLPPSAPPPSYDQGGGPMYPGGSPTFDERGPSAPGTDQGMVPDYANTMWAANLPSPTTPGMWEMANPAAASAPTAAPGLPPVLEGWDASKWANPDWNSTKYVVGRILAKYPATPEGLRQAAGEIQQQFPGVRLSGLDTLVGLPGTQGPVDVLKGAHAGGQGWWWGDQGPGGPQGTPAPMGAPRGPMGGGGGAGAGAPFNLGGFSFDPTRGYQFGYSGGQTGLPPELARFYTAQTDLIRRQQEQDAQIRGTMRDALLKLMAQGQEPVDLENDKTLGPAAAAYRNAQRREGARGREALAERAAFTGLNLGGQGSGAFETALQGNEENIRNSIAGYEAQLAQHELQNRRGLLVNALQIAQALGARTEANDLQRELAQLDAQLRQQALQFQYAQLGQNQGQFEDTMGFNYANLLNNNNRQAILELMR